MKVQVLEEATADLADGFRFYERRGEGLGDYFLDSLWSDIQSLRICGGIHAIHNGYHRLLFPKIAMLCESCSVPNDSNFCFPSLPRRGQGWLVDGHTA